MGALTAADGIASSTDNGSISVTAWEKICFYITAIGMEGPSIANTQIFSWLDKPYRCIKDFSGASWYRMTPTDTLLTNPMDRFFGYIASNSSGTHDIVVMPVPATAAMLLEYEQLTKVITTMQPLVVALAICQRDLEALERATTDQEARLNSIGTPDIPIALVNDLLVESTACVNAFLGSTSAFLGQVTVAVFEQYGKDSSFHTTWHTRRRALHAATLGYRLMYELRNYAQHYGLPLSGVNVHGERSDATQPMQFSCVARLHRDELLASGFNWRQRKSEIEALEPEFELLPLAVDYMQCLRSLILDIAREEKEALGHCSLYLSAVRRETKAPPNARLHLFDIPAHDSIAPPTSGDVVPEEQFGWLLKKLNDAAQLGERSIP